VHRGQELLALRERLPVGSSPGDLLQPDAGQPQQSVIDPDENLPHDAQHARMQQQVVGLVHRSRLGVLERYDPELRLAARDAGEDQPNGVAGQRLGGREQRPDPQLAVGSGLALVGDLHGARA
jgi:hypothetical protein